jgi:hypothetical protein
MPLSFKSPAINTFFTAFCYGTGMFMLQIFLYKCGMLHQFPTREALINWDAAFYHSIAYQGYSYNNWVSNTGFCPMFPWLWQLSHLGIYSICLLNIILFACGFVILSHIVQPIQTEKWVWLSTPSLYFAFIPYPEALFFLLIAVSFYGIVYNKRLYIWLALCAAALTRMNVIFLIPAFIIMELIANPRQEWISSLKKAIVNYCFPILAGIIIFIVVQYAITGVWFAYFIKQRTIWLHVYSNPRLPFQVASGHATAWLNALSLFVCLAGLVIAVRKVATWFSKNNIAADRLQILSCLYFTFSALYFILYSPKWGDQNTTNFVAAHRYIFASPFFFIFLNRVSSAKYKWQHYLFAVVLANLCWLSFGAYVHIQELAYFNFSTLVVILYMASGKRNDIAIALIAISILMQIMQMQNFLASSGID